MLPNYGGIKMKRLRLLLAVSLIIGLMSITLVNASAMSNDDTELQTITMMDGQTANMSLFLKDNGESNQCLYRNYNYFINNCNIYSL